MTNRFSIRQLMLAILFSIIMLLLIAIAIIAHINIKELTDNDVDFAEQALEQMLEKNFTLSKQILTRYGEERVALTAEIVASQLELQLKNYDIKNYDILRTNATLRKVATQTIHSFNGPAGYVDLYDNKGQAVLHPNKEVEGRNYSEWQDQYPEMWKIVLNSFTQKTVSGYYTFVGVDNNQKRKFVVCRQVAGTPFYVSATVEIDAYFVPVHKALRLDRRKVADQAEITIRQSADQLSEEIRFRAGLWALILLFLSSIAGFYLSASISNPVRQLSLAARRLGRGNFSQQIHETGPLEIIDLAHSFNSMRGELIDYIQQIKRETANRQAIESEMRLAREIQTSLLPCCFPAFPEHQEFSLYAINVSAKEVAGDFYDFFFINDETLAVIIADVSGKGMPASLFMAVTRTLFRATCKNVTDPGEALVKVNRALCENNDRCMFVTAVLIYYNIYSGKFSYANAGHDDPIIITQDNLRQAENPGNVVLGVDADQQYTTLEEELAIEETLYLYTDGVTEAVSGDKHFFGREKLDNHLRQAATMNPEQLCTTLADKLDVFQEENQFDDITMVALRAHSKIRS